jgi:Leucine-rich repeat (LRR) protein
MESFDF